MTTWRAVLVRPTASLTIRPPASPPIHPPALTPHPHTHPPCAGYWNYKRKTVEDGEENSRGGGLKPSSWDSSPAHLASSGGNGGGGWFGAPGGGGEWGGWFSIPFFGGEKKPADNAADATVRPLHPTSSAQPGPALCCGASVSAYVCACAWLAVPSRSLLAEGQGGNPSWFECVEPPPSVDSAVLWPRRPYL